MKRKTKTPRPRGFAAMSPELQREIARKGGKKVSKNKRHMANIGRIGGTSTGRTYRKAARLRKAA